MGTNPRISRERITYGLPVAVTFVLGILLTSYLTVRVDDAEERLAQARFAQTALHHIRLVDELVHSQLRELEALRRFITLQPVLDRAGFQQITTLHERLAMAIGWVENVPLSQLPEFQARIEDEYGPAFRLHNPPDSTTTPTAQGRRLYPVTYLKTTLREGFRLGADISLYPQRKAAFDRALASGETVALTYPADAETDQEEAGIILVTPVFRADTGEQVTQRHFGNLRGFVFAHLQLASIAEAITTPPEAGYPAERSEGDIRLDVSDVSRASSPALLFTTRDDERQPTLHFNLDLELADLSVRITAYPDDPELWHSGPTAVVVLASGITGSTLIAAYLASLLRQRRRAERLVYRKTRELQEANAYRSSLLASAVDVAVIATNTNGIITLFSAGAENMLGYRADKMVGRKTPLTYHQPDDVERWRQTLATELGHPVDSNDLYAAAIEAGQHKSQHWVFVHRNGAERQIQLTLSPLLSEAGERMGYLSIGVDITDYLHTVEALEHSDQLLSDLSAEVPGVIYQFVLRPDKTSCYTFISDGVEKIFEVTPAEAKNSVQALIDRVHPDDLEPLYAELAQARKHLTPWMSEFRVQLPTQGIRWLRGEARHRVQEDGCLVSNGFITDITPIKNLEFQLREQATIDPLTQVFNRRHLQNQWRQSVARMRRTRLPSSLIMLDIDHFKAVNDNHGHNTGDEVLVRLSWLLNQQVRSTDVVYRLGGEEFLVVCEDTPLEGASGLAHSLLRKIRTAPMPVVGHITASFGVVEVQPEESMDSAFKRLDNLLYRAKRNGRNQVISEGIMNPPRGV